MPDTTAGRLREFCKELQQIADKYDERVSTEQDIRARLIYAFGEDGETIFSYAVRGHLSHANYLREKYASGRVNAIFTLKD